MRIRGWAAAILTALVLAACSPAANQSLDGDPALDPLFAELKAAPNAQQAKAVEQRIWEAWARSPSPTVDVLLERAELAQTAGDGEAARDFLDEAAKLAPDYAEVWNRRALIAFGDEEYGAAMRDIQETLRREPRHFGALTGLGVIYENLGQERAALEAYRAALDIHPFLEEARQAEQRLAPSLDGRDT
jgi:tetratricopeptide (TPR) repeat protein